MSDFANNYKQELLSAIGTIPMDRVQTAIEWLEEALNEGRQVFT